MTDYVTRKGLKVIRSICGVFGWRSLGVCCRKAIHRVPLPISPHVLPCDSATTVWVYKCPFLSVRPYFSLCSCLCLHDLAPCFYLSICNYTCHYICLCPSPYLLCSHVPTCISLSPPHVPHITPNSYVHFYVSIYCSYCTLCPLSSTQLSLMPLLTYIAIPIFMFSVPDGKPFKFFGDTKAPC